MHLRTMLLVAGVAASAAFASTASAETVRYEFNCNSDGYIHVIAWQSNGLGLEYSTGEPCGPAIRNAGPGSGFSLVVAEKTQLLPNGRAFLGSLEKGKTISVRRLAEQPSRAARVTSGNVEPMQLTRTDVGPRLAALLTSINPGWQRGEQGPARAYSIFDRWGNLITARGEPVLVPGDAGLAIAHPTSGAAEERNAKQRCLDKHGYWRNTGGEWGCWTHAK